MKANEFVKKFKIDSFRVAYRLRAINRYKYVIFYSDEIDFSNEFDEAHKEYMFEAKDVKRLVESHELVESCGGVDAVKQYLMDGNVFRFEEKPLMRKAIADVEACQ